MRCHLCQHVFDDFLYHNKPLLYTDIVKDRGFLCQQHTQLYSDKVSKSDIEKNGVQIGSSLKVYSYSAGDKTITAIIKAKEKLCHMTGILIVDQNQVMDIYSTGVGSGITVISKTSVVDTPTLTNEKSINIPLVPWSSFIFLCIDSYDISES